MHKLRVGVLMGGKSLEREVSFNSGRTICDHLDSTRYEIIPIFQNLLGLLYILPWRFLHRGKISDFEHRLEDEAQLITWDEVKKNIDFAYLAMHGKYAEDGTLQAMLEFFNIPYLGPKRFASALRADKLLHKTVLHQTGVATPSYCAVEVQEIFDVENNLNAIINRMQHAAITFPCIVKPHKEGSSLGISLVQHYEQLADALQKACFVNKYPQKVVIEEKIEGMEFSCIIITDYKTDNLIPLPPTEIVIEAGSAIFDYEQKYMPGRATKFTPARCSPQEIELIQQTCSNAMRALEITNIARIDGFLTPDKRVVIIDPNTIAGMGPTSFLFRQAAEIGMNHRQLINHLIETELHAYGLLDNIIAQEEKYRMNKEVKKLRVAVIFGGSSNEREISLESGRNVIYKLSSEKYEIVPLFLNLQHELFIITPQQLVANSTHEIMLLLDQAKKISWQHLANYADFVFIALHGGVGEDGTLQGVLEMLGLPYNGSSVFASTLCMDKFKTTHYLRQRGFEVPQSILIKFDDWQQNSATILNHILEQFSLPCIVKPHDDGCSVLVQKVATREQLTTALEQLFASKQYALVEEFIVGMELTIGVIGNELVQALPPSQAKSLGDILSIEEKFLPGAGENQTPAPLPEESLLLVKTTIEDAFKALDCAGYARIDCFYQSAQQSPTGKERLIILEVNTLPGLTPATCIFHQAAEVGIKPMEFIDMIIQLGLKKHQGNARQVNVTISEVTLLS